MDLSIYWVIFLGIIQGLTDFLPVSSSGHLVLIQSLIKGFSQPGVLLDVVLHLGTSLSVVYFFRDSILFYFKKNFLLLVVAIIPALLVGYFFQSQIEGLFVNTKFVGFGLLITSFFNFLTDRTNSFKKKINVKQGLIIGLGQSLAIAPGISRSGATIFSGVLSGVEKKKAAEFSFFLSLPTVIGANLLQILTHYKEISGVESLTPYIIGFIISFWFGVFSVKIVFFTLEDKIFKFFGIYCLILGLATLLLL